MIGKDLNWSTGKARLHGKEMPRTTAVTTDMRTAIEIIGPPSAIRQISVVGQAADEVSAQQMAGYMALAMQLILPDWTGANAWLAVSLRMIRRKPNAITMRGWNITMKWLPETSTITLKATR